MREKKLIRSTVDSLSRLAETKAKVRSQVNPAPMVRLFEKLTKPNSVSGTMRKVGIALIASPDIILDVPGAALLAASYATRGKDPTSLGQLASETRKILRDIGSLTI